MNAPVAEISPPRQAAKIAATYLILGVIWILASDHLLHALVDPSLIDRFQIAKGIVFVTATTGLIFTLCWWQLSLPMRLLRELRESEGRFRGTFEQASVGMGHVDLGGRFIRCNKRIRDFLGYTEDELDGLGFMDITHPDDLPRDQEGSRRLLAGEIDSFTMEKRYRSRSGDYLWGEMTSSVVRDEDGKPWFFVKVTQDIRRRKEAEEALRESEARLRALNADLEARVAERTAQLEAVNRELEAFAYSVSHDLKAPLRGIEGYSRLLLEDHAGRLDEEGNLFIGNIRRGVGQMTQLIDDLLAYSRADRRTMRLRPLGVARVISAVVGERSGELARRNIEMGLANLLELEVVAEPEGLSQVFRNLLDNAIKFTGNTPEPRIEIGGREEGGACVLWVRDNGIGFDMTFKERIYEIFQRLHGPDSYPGTGIGLAIVRKAMERMGGRVWAESEEGKGATFFLSLPVPGTAPSGREEAHGGAR